MNAMNKVWYSFGNPIKVKFRKHNCYKCGTKLIIVKHSKIVDQKSEEAKYYIGVDDGMVGPCEFIHKVFYCPKCIAQIEFVTQLSFENIEIFVKKIKNKYLKKGINIEIKKSYELKTGNYFDKVGQLEDIQNLCLTGYNGDKKLFMYEIPILRKNCWERPYYFKIKTKKLIKSIIE